MSIEQVYFAGLGVSLVLMILYSLVGGFSIVSFVRNIICAIFWPIVLVVLLFTIPAWLMNKNQKF